MEYGVIYIKVCPKDGTPGDWIKYCHILSATPKSFQQNSEAIANDINTKYSDSIVIPMDIDVHPGFIIARLVMVNCHSLYEWDAETVRTKCANRVCNFRSIELREIVVPLEVDGRVFRYVGEHSSCHRCDRMSPPRRIDEFNWTSVSCARHDCLPNGIRPRRLMTSSPR